MSNQKRSLEELRSDIYRLERELEDARQALARAAFDEEEARFQEAGISWGDFAPRKVPARYVLGVLSAVGIPVCVPGTRKDAGTFAPMAVDADGTVLLLLFSAVDRETYMERAERALQDKKYKTARYRDVGLFVGYNS